MLGRKDIRLYAVLATLWRRRVPIVAFSFIVTAAAAVYSLRMPNIYRAQALLRLGTANTKVFEAAESIKEVLSFPYTLRNLAKRLGIDPTDRNVHGLSGRFRVYRAGDFDRFVVVSAESSSPEEAKRLVEAISAEVIERHLPFYEHAKGEREKFIHAIVAQEQRLLEQAKVIMWHVDPILWPVDATVIDIPAEASGTPVGPDRIRMISTAFVSSLLFGMLAALAVE